MTLSYHIFVGASLLAGAYAAGSAPFGLLIGKLNGVRDIREHGSGNIGATNVTRVVGKWWGRLCFLLDFIKGAAPTAAALCIMPEAACFTAAAATLGHMFPAFLGFKGGKGVSTAAGALCALNPVSVFCALAVWAVTFLISRYVSLASILAAVLLPLFALAAVTWLPEWCPGRTPIDLIFFAALSLLAVIRHIPNIKRLLNGTENRFSKAKKENVSK